MATATETPKQLSVMGEAKIYGDVQKAYEQAEAESVARRNDVENIKEGIVKKVTLIPKEDFADFRRKTIAILDETYKAMESQNPTFSGNYFDSIVNTATAKLKAINLAKESFGADIDNVGKISSNTANGNPLFKVAFEVQRYLSGAKEAAQSRFNEILKTDQDIVSATGELPISAENEIQQLAKLSALSSRLSEASKKFDDLSFVKDLNTRYTDADREQLLTAVEKERDAWGKSLEAKDRLDRHEGIPRAVRARIYEHANRDLKKDHASAVKQISASFSERVEQAKQQILQKGA